MKKIFFILIFFLISCQLPDNNTEYQEGLVVFGRIELFEINGIAIGEIDTVRVSLSSEIDANIQDTESLYINNANVTITGAFDQDESNIRTITLSTVNDLGKYVINQKFSPAFHYQFHGSIFPIFTTKNSIAFIASTVSAK